MLLVLLANKLMAHGRVRAVDKNPDTCDAASEKLAIAIESDLHARVPPPI